MEMNPYAAPQADVLPQSQATSTEEMIRQQHLKTEVTIKTVGFLYYLGAFGVGTAAVTMLVNTRHGDELINGGFALFLLMLAAGQGVVAYGLRRLLSWARIPTIIFSCVGLLHIPIGTIINGYILAVVGGKKSKTVMTPEYRRIIELTPYIKHKTSVAVWVLLAVLVLVLVGIIVSAMLQ